MTNPRQELWVRVYVACHESSDGIRPQMAEQIADSALRAFDQRFANVEKCQAPQQQEQTKSLTREAIEDLMRSQQ